ncbi:MAG: YceI family protein [Bacteroidota bacterium]
MYKHFFMLAFLSLAINLQAQKYLTRNGNITFHSETPLETIEAAHNQVTSVLDASNGQLAFSVLMKGFQFEKALMQEHFNEKYVESDKYPKATFKGSIQNLDEIDFNTDGTYTAKVSGEMTMHGKTHPVETVGTLEIKDGKIVAKSEFDLAVADYDIKIPSVVRDNIAKVIHVKVQMQYAAYGG